MRRLRIVLRYCVMLAATVAVSSCSLSDPSLTRASGAPAYAPAGAKPPTLTASASELSIPTWQWQRSQLADGRTVVAAAPERYTLRFEGGGRVLVRADCNRGSGAYEVNGNAMKLAPIALTRMGCPDGTQDGEFVRQIAKVASYDIAGGELVLTLADGGTMRFRAQL
ncbi:MAG: META domain-containing protein [Burkholderiales bacterium]|nr:META domain-containing protein [Burkholderiales bacterium]